MWSFAEFCWNIYAFIYAVCSDWILPVAFCGIMQLCVGFSAPSAFELYHCTKSVWSSFALLKCYHILFWWPGKPQTYLNTNFSNMIVVNFQITLLTEKEIYFYFQGALFARLLGEIARLMSTCLLCLLLILLSCGWSFGNSSKISLHPKVVIAWGLLTSAHFLLFFINFVCFCIISVSKPFEYFLFQINLLDVFVPFFPLSSFFLTFCKVIC